MQESLIVFGDRTAQEVYEAAILSSKYFKVLKTFYRSGEFPSEDLLSQLKPAEQIRYIVGIVDEKTKSPIVQHCERLGWKAANVIHPSAVISSSAKIGNGCFVGANATISSNAHLGEHSIVHLNSSLGHDARIGDFSVLLPGARVSGNARIGKKTVVGSNAFVGAGITVGQNCRIDALANLQRNLSDYYIFSSRFPKPLKRFAGNPQQLVTSRESADGVAAQNPVVVVGFGGHGKVVVDALLASGRQVIGVTDLDPPQPGSKLRYFSDEDVWSKFSPQDIDVAVGIASIWPVDGQSARVKAVKSYESRGYEIVGFVHPAAHVAKSASISPQAQIHAGAIIQSNATVGAHTIINTLASVDHDCEIGDFCHVCPGSTLSGGVHISERTHVGPKACIIQGRSLGPASFVAAGATVVADVDANSYVRGIPARPFTRAAK